MVDAELRGMLESTFFISLEQRRHNIDAAEESMLRLFPEENYQRIIMEIASTLREKAIQNRVIDTTPIESIQTHIAEASWYSGPIPTTTGIWNQLHRKLIGKLPPSAIDSIDTSSTGIVADLAPPSLPGTRKGLVVGYVQSGKTANYAAVIAKAADAGYRMVIVLSGLHNNLRRQTQIRLMSDLGGDSFWTPLTTTEDDFGTNISGHAMLSKAENRILAVVKKNSSRLRRLRRWLQKCGSALENCPILIIDDEADQATPNSAGAGKVSPINREIREIWKLVKRGTYVGYTATPFANVFMDPNDDEELYPSNFIRQLPVSSEYFGAEQLFGRFAVDDAADPVDGLDVSREVPEEDAQKLQVPAKQRAAWEAEIVPSLQDAIRWFILATAARWARGQREHSSMLLHFTHYSDPHHEMGDKLRSWLALERESIEETGSGMYRSLWDREKDAACSENVRQTTVWNEVEAHLVDVLDDVQVIVDNSKSNDRLDYNGVDSAGRPLPQTVIAVGGGTLSRGLTLEGLVVSYFTRTSNTYDTLLQMGRWFGYRTGYEDLPRIWLPRDLSDDFRFLATVEEDLRHTIGEMCASMKTPAEIGVKIRSHPGRLEITSRAKMTHAELVHASLSGAVQQTFILEETDRTKLEKNLAAVRKLVAEVGPSRFGSSPRRGASRPLATDVPHAVVQEFMSSYQTRSLLGAPRVELITDWFSRVCPDPLWNVVIVTGPTGARREVDLGLPYALRCVTRRPLMNAPVGEANIKALLSQPDIAADIAEQPLATQEGGVNWKRHRAEHSPDRPLLLIYPIDGQTSPASGTLAKAYRTRRAMCAPDGLPLIGYAVCLPAVADDSYLAKAEYFAVRPNDWAPASPEEASAELEDADDLD